MTSSLVFCSLLSLLIDLTFPKTCCSVFYVLWSSVNLSSMITDLLYMDQLESLWHDFKSPRVLNWCDLKQSIHFFFFLLHKQSPPSNGAKQIARFSAKFLEIMVSTSLLTSLIRGLKVIFLPPLGRRTDTNKEMK